MCTRCLTTPTPATRLDPLDEAAAIITRNGWSRDTLREHLEEFLENERKSAAWVRFLRDKERENA